MFLWVFLTLSIVVLRSITVFLLSYMVQLMTELDSKHASNEVLNRIYLITSSAIGLTFFGFFFRILYSRVRHKIFAIAEVILQVEVLKQIRDVDYWEYKKVYKNSKLFSLLTNDAKKFITTKITNLFDIVSNIIAIFSYLTTIAISNIWALVIVLPFFLIVAVVPFIFENKVKKFEKILSNKNDNLIFSLNENLQNYYSLFFANKKSFIKSNIRNISTSQLTTETKLERLKLMRGYLTSTAAAFSLTFFDVLFGLLLLFVNQEVGTNITAIFLSGLLFNSLVDAFKNVIVAFAGIRTNSVLKTKLIFPLKQSRERSIPSLNLKKFREVSVNNLVLFVRGTTTPLTCPFNLKFEKGKKYAIVGPSGCGKSTFLYTLMGLSKDYAGKITFNDTDYKDISPKTLLNYFAFVSYDNFIFEDTVLNNITFWENQDVSFALKQANLFKEKNVDSASVATRLSEGQKQRVCLARAFQQVKPIVVLDETFSNLDKKNIEIIKQNIKQDKETTYIIVGHYFDQKDPFFDKIINFEEFTVKKVK